MRARDNKGEKVIKKNEVTTEFLNSVGINPFAVDLVVESFDKVSGATPSGVSFIRKGIRITLEKEAVLQQG